MVDYNRRSYLLWPGVSPLLDTRDRLHRHRWIYFTQPFASKCGMLLVWDMVTVFIRQSCRCTYGC